MDDRVAARSWTADEVDAALIAAFRSLPDRPIYSPRKLELLHALGSVPAPELDIVAAAVEALGRGRRECVILLTWARAKACGPSIGEYCREHGLRRRSFERTRDRAASKLAVWLNTEPKLDSVASGDGKSLPLDQGVEACPYPRGHRRPRAAAAPASACSTSRMR